MLLQGQTNGFFNKNGNVGLRFTCRSSDVSAVQNVYSRNATSEVVESRELQVCYVSTYSKKAEMPIRVEAKPPQAIGQAWM